MLSKMKSRLPMLIRSKIHFFRKIKSINNLFGIPRGAFFLNMDVKKVIANDWENIYIEKNVTIKPYTVLHTNSEPRKRKSLIIVKENSFINFGCFFSSGNKIEIKENCLIGPHCHFLGAGHDYSHPVTQSYVTSKTISYGEIIIGSNTWIGANVTIIGNISIGDGCIIAAGTILRNIDVPPFCLVAGNPAKIVKTYNRNNDKWE